MSNSTKQNIDRRSFLKGAGAVAVGFPYVVRSTALGLSGSVAPSNRIVIAGIGVGSMGQADLRSFLGKPEVQVVAVCDVDLNHAQQAKRMTDERYGNEDCQIYRDYREILQRQDLDAVFHALPDQWHGIIAVACARAGLDIHGQKPLSRTITEGRAIVDAVQRYGCIWQTGSWQRSVAHFRRAAEWVYNNRIGKVSRVEVGLPDGGDGPAPKLLDVPETLNWDMWLGPAPWKPYQSFGKRNNPHWDWRWIMDYSGGQLTDWAGHHVDIAHWGLGLDRSGPVQIEGKGVYPTGGIYDVPKAYKCSCLYANGLEMTVANASQLPHGMGVCWYGADGWVHVNRGGIKVSNPDLMRDTVGPHEKRLYRSDDHFQNFLDCIKSRQETVTPVDIAHRSISVGLLCEIAMLTGRKIQWDPQTETIANDPEASRLLSRPMRSPWHI